MISKQPLVKRKKKYAVHQLTHDTMRSARQTYARFFLYACSFFSFTRSDLH